MQTATGGAASGVSQRRVQAQGQAQVVYGEALAKGGDDEGGNHG